MCRHCELSIATGPATAARTGPAGLTLIELLVAITIVSLIVAALGAMASAVQSSAGYSQSHATATQNARVALQRIGRAIESASASDLFPGALVVATEVGTWRFPDALVVWNPDTAPADPEGLPRFNELKIYCPRPNRPNELVELTTPNDARTTPSPQDTSAWQTELERIKSSSDTRSVVLTGLLRTALPADPSVDAAHRQLRGTARFEVRYRPDPAQLAAYRSGSATWESLPWVQGIYGSQTGLAQTWVRIELQVVPEGNAHPTDPSASLGVAYFGSGALFYEVHQ